MSKETYYEQARRIIDKFIASQLKKQNKNNKEKVSTIVYRKPGNH